MHSCILIQVQLQYDDFVVTAYGLVMLNVPIDTTQQVQPNNIRQNVCVVYKTPILQIQYWINKNVVHF